MDFWAISTEIEILVLMLITILMDLVLPKADSRRSVGYITAAGLAAILFAAVGRYHAGVSPTFFAGLFLVDNYALFFKQMFIMAIIFAVLFSLDYVEKCLRYRGEYYTLLLSALHRTGADDGILLYSCRVADGFRGLQRGGSQISGRRSGIDRCALVWDQSCLRRGRELSLRGSLPKYPSFLRGRACRGDSGDDRIFLQIIRHSFPHVGAGRLSGGADAGHSALGNGVQSGGSRCFHAGYLHGVYFYRSILVAATLGVCGTLNDRRQYHGDAPD